MRFVTGRHVEVDDTRLWIVEEGEGLPLIVLHGGPGLDHTMFRPFLDPLAEDLRLIYVDERSQGRSDPAPPETWTLERQAADVTALATSLGLDEYAVLGHSYGAFIALQHAADFPGAAAKSIISDGAPAARYLEAIEGELENFEPVELRKQVADSWAREADAHTQEESRQILIDQMPFHFADPRDPRIAGLDFPDMVFAPDVLQASATSEYGGIELEDRLGDIPQPVLVLCGRHERTCPLAASEAMAAGIPDARLVVFEHSAHMAFVEEQDAYLAAVREFLLG
jgi:proline iminopeptidase